MTKKDIEFTVTLNQKPFPENQSGDRERTMVE
jgi:hypothetical protein